MITGILIIGSLEWRDDATRNRWRDARLEKNVRIGVRAPIRYGRLSSNKTFTMTFRNDGRYGDALIAPCRYACSDLDSLLLEARALWLAEGGIQGRIRASWGCVGALFGVEVSDVKQQWSEVFQNQSGPDIRHVNRNGILEIPWPTLANAERLRGFDVLVATSNIPAAEGPTAEHVANAWINEGHENYFFENVRCGIRTPEDRVIWAHMEKSKKWLKTVESKYPKAIETLRTAQ